MYDVLVLCPTRAEPGLSGRIDGAVGLYESVKRTSDATVAFYIDSDQEDLYRDFTQRVPDALIHVGAPLGPIHAFNELAATYPARIYSCATDDATYEAQGWDDYVMEVIAGFKNRIGVVSPAHNYGDFCNFVTTSREWIDTLGFLAYTGQYHFVWDTITELLGDATNIVYADKDKFRMHHQGRMAHHMDKLQPDSYAFVMWCVTERRAMIRKLKAAMA